MREAVKVITVSHLLSLAAAVSSGAGETALCLSELGLDLGTADVFTV